MTDSKHLVKTPPPLPCAEICGQHELLVYRLDEMGKTLGRIEGLLEDQNKKLFISNGVPCLAERVKTLEASVEKAKGNKTTHRANMVALWIAVGGSFALYILPALATGLQKLIAALPTH
jgi:hypothetical protein